MQTLMQDVRYAVRMLAKSKAFSAIAILSLAFGIGANTTIFTVVNAILLHPLPVKDISRLVEVDTVDTKTVVTIANVTKLGMSYPNCQDYARENQVFSGTVCFAGPLPLTWSGRAEPKQVLGNWSRRITLTCWGCVLPWDVSSCRTRTPNPAATTSLSLVTACG